VDDRERRENVNVITERFEDKYVKLQTLIDVSVRWRNRTAHTILGFGYVLF